jgi:transposase
MAARWQGILTVTTLLAAALAASPVLLDDYSQQILALIREQRDLTLNEIVSVLHRRRIPASRSALSRFFARHGITFKKKPAGSRAQASRRGSRASTLDS